MSHPVTPQRGASTKPCSVPGCLRAHVARGYCQAHWRRWKKYGEPGVAEVRAWAPGRVCSAEGCDRAHNGGRGYCEGHLRRLRGEGTPGPAEFQPVRGPRRDIVTYQSAHRRVESARGRAADHLCDHCRSPAQEWAYDHRDENELRSLAGRPYSLHVTHYFPLCRPCHRRFDHARKVETS